MASLGATSLVAAPTHASTTQASVMQDDDQLIHRSAKVRDRALDTMRKLGVDIVRVTVLWRTVAEDARSGRNRKRFKGNNPRTYPWHNWDRFDELVHAAGRRKLRVYFNVTGPGPSWAHKRGGSGSLKRSWMPKAREFYRFVAAVGKRYSGRYRDENGKRRKLPKVTMWSLWNEGNQPAWLAPQFEAAAGLGGRVIPRSPHLYRELYLQGYKALVDTGHRKNTILIGETAPLGKDEALANTPMRPGLFIREMLCLDGSMKPFTGAEREARGCDRDFEKFGRIVASGWAHHPYTKTVSPLVAPANPDDITMANAARLPALLDAAATATNGLIAKGLGVAMTEFGYETKPDDPYNGISRETAAEYSNLGDWLAWQSPRVVTQAQFLLRDSDLARGSGRKRYKTYQSGLVTRRGKAKIAARAYAFPLVRTPRTDGRIGFWGQLRFRTNKQNRGTVIFQFLPSGAKDWVNVGEPAEVRDALGFFTTHQAPRGPGLWRAMWLANSKSKRPALSREIAVTG